MIFLIFSENDSGKWNAKPFVLRNSDTDMRQHECTQTLLKIIKNLQKYCLFLSTPNSFPWSFPHLNHITLQNVHFEHFYAPCHLQKGCFAVELNQFIHRSNAEGIQQPSFLGLWRQRWFLRLLSYAFRRQRGFHPRIRNLAILNIIVKVRINHFVTAVRSIWLKI